MTLPPPFSLDVIYGSPLRQLEPVETVETESMMEDEELMELLSSRKKRSAGMGRGRAMPLPNQRRGGFDLEPPVYGRTRHACMDFFPSVW